MTTEIAVINRLGVALAADSAVTISGFGSEKVFDTGDKLFELHPDYPVGIMVNGNLDFLGVPWELIIKDFRAVSLQALPQSIEAWALEFLSFARSHRAVNDEQCASFVRQFLEEQVHRIQQRVGVQVRKTIDDGHRTVNRSIIADLLSSEISNRRFELEAIPVLSSLSSLRDDRVGRLAGPIITDVIKRMFGKRGISRENNAALRNVLITELMRTIDEGTGTGLVVCGFGGDDLFPSLYGVSIDGVLAGFLRYSVTHDVEITRDAAPGNRTKELGTAISFAQTDVIDRLLRGGDERLIDGSRRFVERSVGKALAAVVENAGWTLSDGNGKNVPLSRLTKFLGDRLPSFYEETVKRIGDEIEREFKQTIALMPKQELLELAEALVSITAVERKATRDAGTVGGPIDVALITRSEGFVWIKRKHYFSAELNPRYVSRVQRMSNGG